ncbi:hypothetical protein BDF19DRAFT_476223, partial [Syncephalis fuscata]
MTALSRFYSQVALPQWRILSRPNGEETQATLYIKGFLAEGETADHFEDWMWSHRLLMLSPKHRWSGTVYGYSWPSGQLSSLLPRPSATIASGLYSTYIAARGLSAITPASALATIGVDMGLNAARIIRQYRHADEQARERAHELFDRLIELRKQYKYVRVVAHSLGCRHILEALREAGITSKPADVSSTPNTIDPRPDWLHLCAPACAEPDVADILSAGAARQGTFLYYTQRDTVLSIMFRLGHPHRYKALGATGPTAGLGVYPGLYAESIDDIFNWRVHTAYARQFHRFAISPS